MNDWSQREWWPLAIALTWVISPRLALTPRISTAGTRLRIAQEVARASAIGWLAVGPRETHLKLDFDRAWEAVRELAVDGKIVLRGEPWVRLGSPSSWSGNDGPSTTIPEPELECLSWHLIHGEDCLGPSATPTSAYPPTSARFWRRVTVSRIGLAANFHQTSAAPPNLSVVGGKKDGGRPPQHDRATAIRILDELFDEHGAISADDEDWRSVEQVADKLGERFQLKRQKSRHQPGQTWLKGRVNEYLKAHPDLDGRKSRKPG